VSLFLGETKYLPPLPKASPDAVYPAWAPADLVARIRKKWPIYRIPKGKVGLLPGGDFGRDLLGVLLSAPDMKPVWQALARRKRRVPAGETFVRTDSAAFYAACETALINWAALPKRTRAEDRKLYQRIERTSIELINLIIESRNSEILRLQRFFQADWSAGLGDLFELDMKDADDYARFWIADRFPDTAELLENLAAQAAARARQPKGAPQPKAGSAAANFFARELSRYFRRAYGQPLHEHVAAVTSTVFGVATDANRIRKLVSE